MTTTATVTSQGVNLQVYTFGDSSKDILMEKHYMLMEACIWVDKIAF